MSLHRLTSVTMGVPNVRETMAYYTDFGLTPVGDGTFRTEDAGNQLRGQFAPTRRLVELGIGADDPDDVAAVAARLDRAGVERNLDAGSGGRILRVTEPIAGFATVAFFTEGLGFVISDYIGDKGAFMRCSADHHNVLALAAPVNFLHHTSWQVNDVDDIGRGAANMLASHSERHVWGLGRHHAGSNFFWYLKDQPATSPSTTPTWTASPRMKSGSPRCSKAPRACSAGAASPAVLPGSRRPRRDHDRPALRRLRINRHHGSVHCWLLPPSQSQMSSWVPSVVLKPGSSRQRPDTGLT